MNVKQNQSGSYCCIVSVNDDTTTGCGILTVSCEFNLPMLCVYVSLCMLMCMMFVYVYVHTYMYIHVLTYNDTYID